MPLTASGEKVLKNMEKEYGSAKKAKEVFYASINKGKPGFSKMHKKRKAKKHASYGKATLEKAKASMK